MPEGRPSLLSTCYPSGARIQEEYRTGGDLRDATLAFNKARCEPGLAPQSAALACT
jgi:hypothetical protein